jgi:ElaB/YqjD/DUF883 family membrane-anchored ribosome-binding protein
MSTTPESSFPPSYGGTPTPETDAGGRSPSLAPDVSSCSGTDLLGRVVHGAHDTIDRLAETAEPHVRRIQEEVSSASDAVQSRANQLRETGDEWGESLRAMVRENPLAALAAALAVGMLVSRLTRR